MFMPTAHLRHAVSHIIVSIVRLERPQVSIKLEALPLSSLLGIPAVVLFRMRHPVHVRSKLKTYSNTFRTKIIKLITF